MLKEIIKKRLFSVIAITFLIILEVLLSIPLPYISKYLIDEVIGKSKYNLVWDVFVVFIVILAIQLLVGNLLVRLVASFEAKAITGLRESIMKFIVRQKDIGSAERSRAQEVLLNDLGTYFSNITEIYYHILSNSLKVIGCLIIIFNINFYLSALCLVFIPIYIGWTIYISYKLKQLTYKIKKVRENIIRTVNNILYNLMSIKLYDLFSVSYKAYKNSIIQDYHTFRKTKIYMNIVSIVSNIIVTSATFVPLFWGVGLIQRSILSLGDLIAFNAYIGMLFTPITSLTSVISTLKMNSVYKERILEYFPNDVLYDIEKINASKKQINNLTVTNFELSVGDRKLIKDANLKVRSGDVIRISGDNGCGKTLFLKSLLNLSNYFGSISYNGLDLSNKNTEQLNRHIVYVANELGFMDL